MNVIIWVVYVSRESLHYQIQRNTMHLDDLQNPHRLDVLEHSSDKCVCFVLPQNASSCCAYTLFFHGFKPTSVVYNLYRFRGNSHFIITIYLHHPAANSVRPKTRFKSWQEAKIKLQVAWECIAPWVEVSVYWIVSATPLQPLFN